MIFGHLGVAFLFKAKFYKKSLIIFIICCFIPDILYYFIYGIQYVIGASYPPVYNGLLRWIINLSGAEIKVGFNQIPLSHSIVLYVIFLTLIFVYLTLKKRGTSGLIYFGAIFSHLVLDIILLDHYWGVYPFFPFDPSQTHFIPFLFYSDSIWFWVIDLVVFSTGFFVILWAFSKYEGKELET